MECTYLKYKKYLKKKNTKLQYAIQMIMQDVDIKLKNLQKIKLHVCSISMQYAKEYFQNNLLQNSNLYLIFCKYQKRFKA